MKINALVLTILGNHGAGKVLTSDSSGNATWQTPSTGSGAMFDGGNAASTYSGGPILDCGHAT